MTETQPEPTEQPSELFDAPDDAADDVAKGYAVYDRTLGRFVTGVTPDKPSISEARKSARGHTVKVVRV